MGKFYHPLGENHDNPGLNCMTYYHPQNGPHQYGGALDFCIVPGTPVYSMCEGEIIWASDGYDNKYGSSGGAVIVRTKNTGLHEYCGWTDYIYIKYLHLQSIDVPIVHYGNEANYVPIHMGQRIGEIGWLGGSANGVSHLHLDISTIPNRDLTSTSEAIDVTRNGIPSHMSNYNEVTSGQAKIWAQAALNNVDTDFRSYIFAIFNQPVTYEAGISGDDIGCPFPTFTEDYVMTNSSYSFERAMTSLATLCCHEMQPWTSAEDGYLDRTLSSYCVYAKLLRYRLIRAKKYSGQNQNIVDVMLAPAQFEGFTMELNFDTFRDSRLDKDLVLNSIMNNFMSPAAINITDEYKAMLANSISNEWYPYYNYGYGGRFGCNMGAQNAINAEVNGGAHPGYVSGKRFIGAVGNTGFWGEKI